MPTKRPNGSDSGLAPVYILAGGQSRRFGSDKAREIIQGQPLILLLANTLREGSRRVSVVARKTDAYGDLGLRTIGDEIPGKGPLGGILTALRDAGDDPWVGIVACDWVGVAAQWLRRLESSTGHGDVILFESTREQPLFGLYRASLASKIAERIGSDQLKMQDLLAAINVARVPAPRGWMDGVNMNRPIQR